MKCPISVKVVSISNIAFGAIGLVSACVMTLAVVVAQMPPQPGMNADEPYFMLLRDHTVYRTITLGLSLAGAMTSMLLLASGVGMLARQGWARWMAIVWSGVRLVRITVETAVNVVIVVPFLASHSPPPSGANVDPSMFTLLTQSCCGCMMILPAVFPVAVLIVLFRAEAAGWFGGEHADAVEPWNA